MRWMECFRGKGFPGQMLGRRNSVFSRVLEKQPNVFRMACVCHLAALSAAAGLKPSLFLIQ